MVNQDLKTESDNLVYHALRFFNTVESQIGYT